MTLIELLVVVSMLIILVAVLTSAMQPVLAGKEVREAARQLNAYIASSIVRAAQTGRPAGVWIQRYDFDENPATADGAAFEVFFAEVPPLYAGDLANSHCTLNANTVDFPSGSVSPLWGADGAVGGGDDIVQAGDLIKFNYVGPWYSIASVSGSSLTFTTGDKPPPPPYASTAKLPFQIRRQARKSAVEPLQLPAGTVIDLTNSGVGNGADAQAFATGTGAVAIMFSPSGSVENVIFDAGGNTITSRVLDTIHLLVGRPGDQIGANNLGTAPNDNRWVSINPQTGRVITTENMGDANSDGNLADAREFATTGQAMGGG